MFRARALVAEGADYHISHAVIVPFRSVLRHEGGEFVFVRDQPDLFSLRRVALGASNGDSVAVLAGLEATDAVVMDGGGVGQYDRADRDRQRLPLRTLASIEETEGAATINREWGRRLIRVQCKIAGRDAASFVVEWGGQ